MNQIEINDCGICLDSLNNNIETLPCNHIFHIECIKKLTMSKCILKNNCPICRCHFKNQDQEQKQEQEQDQDQEQDHRPSTPTSSPNPTFSLPIVHAMLFCCPNYPRSLHALYNPIIFPNYS